MTNTDLLLIGLILMSLGFYILLYAKLAGIERRQSIILRKLNNSQPDDEGGY